MTIVMMTGMLGIGQKKRLSVGKNPKIFNIILKSEARLLEADL